MNNTSRFLKGIFGTIIFFLCVPMLLQAQPILIDKSVKAGDLTLFPAMGDENSYYYLPDQLRLATHANGDPQFSFLRYVENVRSAPGEAEIREGTGGGIVHAVISLSVTPDQIAEAKNQLRQINGEGVLKGPVIYSGGTMSIISSFVNPEGELTEQVVGIGKAPLIDGQKAAVSIELTKKGAKILWESFQTPTPDMSFSFEMELQGYRSPKQAIIEADFEKIYSHHGFQAGVAGGTKNIMFGGEIDIAFDELRNNGAIKITNMGSDTEMDKLVETAYNKLTTMMFNPVGTGDNLTKELVKGITGKKSMLDRATDLYKQKPASKTGKKTASFFPYPVLDDRLLWASIEPVNTYTLSSLYTVPLGKQADWEPKHITKIYKDCINGLPLPEEIKYDYNNDIDAERYIKMAMLNNLFKEHNTDNKPNIHFYKYLLSEEEQNKFANILNGTREPDDEIKQLIRDRVVRVVYTQEFLNEKQKTYLLDEVEPDIEQIWNPTLGLTYVAFLNRNEIKHMPQTEQWAIIVQKIYNLRTPSDDNTVASDDKPGESQVEDKENNADKGDKKPNTPDTSLNSKDPKTDPSNLDSLLNASTKKVKPESPTAAPVPAGKPTASKGEKKSDNKGTAKAEEKKKADVKKKEKESDFRMAIMASYQFKKIKQKGKFKINLNKYTADKLILRFDENIGSINCDKCFHQVNLDDPLFKQREVVAMLDGFNFTDFGQYINFVSLKMKKTHQDGNITYDEVRIDRDNFAAAANNFKLLYGWKGDDNRTKWLDYEFQAQWSFFGGNEVISDWTTSNGNAINLSAPYVRRTVELESDPEFLKENKVRSVNVKIYYQLGDKEEVKTVSMMPSREQYSSSVDIMLPEGVLEYEYEISWRLYGNKSHSSGRQRTSEMILFVDELEI